MRPRSAGTFSVTIARAQGGPGCGIALQQLSPWPGATRYAFTGLSTALIRLVAMRAVASFLICSHYRVFWHSATGGSWRVVIGYDFGMAGIEVPDEDLPVGQLLLEAAAEGQPVCIVGRVAPLIPKG